MWPCLHLLLHPGIFYKTLFTPKPRRANLIRHTIVKDYKHSSRVIKREAAMMAYVIYAEICYLCNI